MSMLVQELCAKHIMFCYFFSCYYLVLFTIMPYCDSYQQDPQLLAVEFNYLQVMFLPEFVCLSVC